MGAAGLMPLLIQFEVIAASNPRPIEPSSDSIELSRGAGELTQLAQNRRRRYRPPADSRIPGRNHSGGGVRGCGSEIAAIAPRLSGIGQTVSTHPTLVWYNASSDALPLELQLYRYKSDGTSLDPVFIRPVEKSRQGYMTYTLPETDPGLQVGETYFWQVILYCDNNFEEVGMWTAADIQVVPEGAIASQLSENAIDNAQLYSDQGLWYDAVAEVFDRNNSAAESFLQTLLLDLADLEADADSEAAEKISRQLQQIAEMQ